MKYPQTLETEKNRELSNLVITKDDLDHPSNDLVKRSGIQFQLKADNNYNEEIMQFFNFLTSLLNKHKNYAEVD